MPKTVAQKEDWISLGFKLFAETGIGGINVEKMATRLKCNKSSFYWHFTTKDEFVDEIIKFWIYRDTKAIIEATNKGKTPASKFRILIAEIFKEDPTIDFIFYLKRYGQKRKDVQALIDEIDTKRIQFVEDLFRDFGLSPEESKSKSALFYKYLIGYHEMNRYKKIDKNYIDLVIEDLLQFLPLNL